MRALSILCSALLRSALLVVVSRERLRGVEGLLTLSDGRTRTSGGSERAGMDGGGKASTVDASVYGVAYLCGSCGAENKIRHVRPAHGAHAREGTRRGRGGRR